jgi:Flp pilus assembly protein TadD
MEAHLRTPTEIARRQLAHVFLQQGAEAGLRRLREVQETAPQILGESLTNLLGYHLLAQNEIAAAVEVFRRNVELHPGSSNAWNSLAEAYLHAGEIDLATDAYRRSVELDRRNANSRWMLNQLAHPS